MATKKKAPAKKASAKKAAAPATASAPTRYVRRPRAVSYTVDEVRDDGTVILTDEKGLRRFTVSETDFAEFYEAL